MKKLEKSLEIGGKTLTLTTGNVAQQANSAVIATYGETVVMATVVSAPLRNDPGYFPLTVEYQEKLYAGGRIKGSRWIKREGKPSDEEILVGRLIDRSIRPLFPKEYKEDVQVIVTVLSVDMENPPETVAANAVSAALAASDLPWMGPVGVVKVGSNDTGFIANPTITDLETSKIDLVVSSTKSAIVMIEAGANQVPEDKVLEAIEYAQKEGGKIIKFINDFAKEVGKEKKKVESKKTNSTLEKKVKEVLEPQLKDLAKKLATKEASYADLDEIRGAFIDSLEDEEKAEAGEVFEKYLHDQIRKMLVSGKRPDGRKTDELRKISCEVDVLPRTHGSAIFNRGQTQALSIATIGEPSLEQFIETAEGEETKRYIHHYSMPPFSTGETGRVGSPSRREIGHGALAERALLPVIPSQNEFPYTIQVVSEILSSNGSTSMASTCGSTLSLMDAGVPIKAPIAGIAMGVVIEDEKNFVVLTDIVGLEDGNGDMDFKVAGSKDGITALQLDVKTQALTSKILGKALEQAKKARMEIMDVMLKTIPESKSNVSEFAPKIKIINIDTDKIGELIGPGGKVIKAIIASSGAQVDVDEDGKVFISSTESEAVEKAIQQIDAIVKDPQPGEIYDGTVKRIQPFGAFVEILPGREGLVHVSDMSQDFVKDPADIVAVGDVVKVRVKEIDQMGRLNLSMLLDGDKKKQKYEDQGERRFEKGYPRRNDRRGDNRRRDDRRNSSRRGNSNRPSSGPHFPASRLLDETKKEFNR